MNEVTITILDSGKELGFSMNDLSKIMKSLDIGFVGGYRIGKRGVLITLERDCLNRRVEYHNPLREFVKAHKMFSVLDFDNNTLVFPNSLEAVYFLIQGVEASGMMRAGATPKGVILNGYLLPHLSQEEFERLVAKALSLTRNGETPIPPAKPDPDPGLERLRLAFGVLGDTSASEQPS